MQPRVIRKQIDKVIDLVQLDLEETKAKKDFQLFKSYTQLLEYLKLCRNQTELVTPYETQKTTTT